MTFLLNAFGLTKAPLILFCGPKVEDISDKECVIRVPLNRRTRNHLNSMYFGALCIGADVAAGLLAVKKMKDQGFKGQFAFKDFQAQFLKRSEGDTLFYCQDGLEIDNLIDELKSHGGRKDKTLRVEARVPSQLGSEPVFIADITISIKAL